MNQRKVYREVARNAKKAQTFMYDDKKPSRPSRIEWPLLM
jgi:hypothetical protein